MYKNFRRTLKERELSIYRVSQIAKIAPPDLYTALSGKKPLYPGWRKRIAEALDMPEEALFNDEEACGTGVKKGGKL